MQPAARLTAAIELLTDIEEKMAAKAAPADVLVTKFFRARRYAGSKDKRAISDYVYGILRARALYRWALKRLGATLSARNMMIVHLVRHDADALRLFGEDNPFAPTRLNEEEEDFLRKLKHLDWHQAPIEAAYNLPDWALPGLTRRFGKSLATAAASLNETAPLDIRVNSLKASGKSFDQILKNESELFEKNKFSALGYRAKVAINLGAHKAFSDGLIEVQDEAAQLASSLVDAYPGAQVVDLCAGAGGKTLAMAATMENRGQIHAFDISPKRLSSLKKRMQRAGARTIQVHQVTASGAGREIAFGPLEGMMDRVVVDAPCTGTGTWRRSPDQRWRFDAESLKAQAMLQGTLLAEGAKLVKQAGRLVYMTCSVLPEENEDVVASFLKGQPEGAWKVLDYKSVWAETLTGAPAETQALSPEFLQLAPHAHDTDGFFLAVLERSA